MTTRIMTVGLIVAALLLAACVSEAGTQGNETFETPGASPEPIAAAVDPGCEEPVLDIDLDAVDDDGEPFKGRTNPIQVPIWRGGEKLNDLAAATADGFEAVVPKWSPNDLAIQAIVKTPASAPVSDEAGEPVSLFVYYSKEPLDENASWAGILASGGASFKQSAASGRTGKAVADELGDLGSTIKVGPHDAAFTHSDVLPGGFRAYGIYWSDGDYDFSLVVNGSARAAISAAQSMYCL